MLFKVGREEVSMETEFSLEAAVAKDPGVVGSRGNPIS